MSTAGINPSMQTDPSLLKGAGVEHTAGRRAVHFGDGISEGKTEVDPPIDPPKGDDVSCWDSFCNAFVDGFSTFAQTIVDFFINLFRSRDALDGLKDKVYAAIGTKQWDTVLLETAAMIKWTRDNKSTLTDSQLRRANAIIQDVYSYLDVVDPNISKTDTVLKVLKAEINADEKTAFEYMVKNPRAEVIMTSMVGIARGQHLGNMLQNHVLAAKKMEAVMSASVVIPRDRTLVLAQSLERLAILLNNRTAVLDLANEETTRIYQAAILRFLKLIDRADRSQNKELSGEIIDGFDFSKSLPSLSEAHFYDEMLEKAAEVLDLVTGHAEESLRSFQPLNTTATVAHAASKFKALLNRV